MPHKGQGWKLQTSNSVLSTTRSHYFFCKSQHSLLHLLKLGYNIPSDKLFFSHTAKVYFSLSYHFPPNITKYYKLLLFERYSLKKGKPDWICFCKYLCDKGLLSTLQKLQVIIFLVFSGFLSFLLFSFLFFFCLPTTDFWWGLHQSLSLLPLPDVCGLWQFLGCTMEEWQKAKGARGQQGGNKGYRSFHGLEKGSCTVWGSILGRTPKGILKFIAGYFLSVS